jgi:hypothetical protein
MLLHSSRVHVPCSGPSTLSLIHILMLTLVYTDWQRSTEVLFMPFKISSIRSITMANDSNYAEGQRLGRSVNNTCIARHPRYRKAILRIGESNYNVRYLNHFHTIYFSFISYYIVLDKFHHSRPGSEQYASRRKYPDGHLRLQLFTFFAKLICLHPTEVPFTYARQVVFFVLGLATGVANTLFVDLSLVGVRTLPYGFLAAFDPVGPISVGNHTNLRNHLS